MKTLNQWRGFVGALLALLPAVLLPARCFAWGSQGHRIINGVAMQMLPPDLPAFLRTPDALGTVVFLGPEPDRWRSSQEPELKEATAPEHFIDLELADLAAPDGLPAQRDSFLRDLARSRATAMPMTPQRVGLLPWQIENCYQRLAVDMRVYRQRLAAGRDLSGIQQAILYDIGILGHFVGDGSQPLHTTVDYNGWVEARNPQGFTRSRTLHRQFETEFVQRNLTAAQVRALVPAQPGPQVPLFPGIVDYLRASHRQVQELYRLEKSGGFSGSGTAESRIFTAERLAAGASMLRDLIDTAWAQSAVSHESASHD